MGSKVVILFIWFKAIILFDFKEWFDVKKDFHMVEWCNPWGII